MITWPKFLNSTTETTGPMKESYIQGTIIKWLESIGCYCIKTIVTSKKGTPDIICCLPDGKFFAIEVKRPGGVVSKIQDYTIRKIQLAGGYAMVAYSLKDVKTYLEELGYAD